MIVEKVVEKCIFRYSYKLVSDSYKLVSDSYKLVSDSYVSKGSIP
jgi:hypothetical protein